MITLEKNDEPEGSIICSIMIRCFLLIQNFLLNHIVPIILYAIQTINGLVAAQIFVNQGYTIHGINNVHCFYNLSWRKAWIRLRPSEFWLTHRHGVLPRGMHLLRDHSTQIPWQTER